MEEDAVAMTSVADGYNSRDDSRQKLSPAWPLSSPETPVAPVQFQRSVPTPLLRSADGRLVHEEAHSTHNYHVQSPIPDNASEPRRARSKLRENNYKSSTQESGTSSRRQTPARSNTLNLYTEGGTSIDEHLRSAQAIRSGPGRIPSPPPSDVNTLPVLSPVEDVGDLPVLNGSGAKHDTGSNSRRERAASSALDFDAGPDSRPMPEDDKSKGRAMSETRRPSATSRTYSAPMFRRKGSSSKATPSFAAPLKDSVQLRSSKDVPTSSSRMDRVAGSSKSSARHDIQPPSPTPESIPMPPLSMPTFLQLELSSGRPSPLFMYRPSTMDYPFESTSVKAERLMNFLILAPQLERVLWFGTIACVDAWLYNFTILPLRFALALIKLFRSLLKNLWAEVVFLTEFVPHGLGRVWQRQVRGQLHSEPPTPSLDTNHPRRTAAQFPFPDAGARSPPFLSRPSRGKKHRRSRSIASSLVSAEKADILTGCLIVASTMILMRFDASMMYHSIRGQAAIKLYVIYNVLEVFDRLLSAIGQDILECLFSPESLSRHANGRSKILRPLSLFPIALIYVLIHATALYYQVITLNVAVNSYSNALLTLLMSNQFVEIKSTVFKRIEKENLFQMTCADIVERFQLWLMLVIIASRNIIETNAAATTTVTPAPPPPTSPSLLPFSFTLFPSLSFSQILNPFILVLGTETIVDWIKHAYINKFNNVKPNLYGRFVDVLAKDYYGNAFGEPHLTKRIGLPVIPLTCLAIRAAVQTYNMFQEHVLSAPLASGVTAGFPSTAGISPTTAAALHHVDSLFLKVVGETNAANGSVPTVSSWLLPSEFAIRYLPSSVSDFMASIPLPSTDTLVTWGWTALIVALIYLVLLAFKIVLGMALLSYARSRYTGMKDREQQSSRQEGRRMGGWGTTEVDEDKRRWIYADDPERLKKLRDRDRETREKEIGSGTGTGTTKKDGVFDGKSSGYEGVERYKLGSSKRIW